uniref:VLIG-type G domain-containing protein n=1 Tax=Scleropages formosus TaxID=113540 RepID=A0A8C9T7G8_SCLFO
MNKLLLQNLEYFHPKKLTTADILTIDKCSVGHQPQTEEDVAVAFLQKLLVLDYRGRQVSLKDRNMEPLNSDDFDIMQFIDQKKKEAEKAESLHPMDVQMAVFHCADNFLRQYMMNKLSFCQYALPLLVPNPVSGEIEFPLWTFRQIKKTWKTLDTSKTATSRSEPVYKAFTPMVFFCRIGTVTSSKSQLMNSVINPRHNTFFHRHCPGSSRTCHLMDGVVEIAWYCSSGKPDDTFNDCIAFCNLHGDAEKHIKQRKFLVEKSAVSVVLLQKLDLSEEGKDVLPQFLDTSKPLIFLLSNERTSLSKTSEGHFQIGLKDRNQAEVIEELTMIIKYFLKRSNPVFNLGDIAESSEFSVDETETDCWEGKLKADTVIKELDGTEFSQIKVKLLPRQGRPWQEWSKSSKDLHRLHGNVMQMESEIHQKMKSLRQEQRSFPLSDLMKHFLREIQSGNIAHKMYFLKWVSSLMDDLCEDKLSVIRKQYDAKWTEALQLKNKHDKRDELRAKQEELEKVSEELSDGTCGLEHLMREMGQIYEAWESQKEGTDRTGVDISSLPALAADIMISGFPIELMDGDAAHVPMQWIDAVLGKVVEKIGNERLFVLSVLGLQSTGKSTMLNAMFGLQFAVSAGRCTRGAFMQLVKVSGEAQKELKTDYFLVVDTEGLRALESAGKATVHHDNELATFVIGLGNMTLINVFGENPAEIHDTVQIAIQAFLRMKKVKLSPSCIFVHQNVADIAAGEKNMEGKRRLQEKLDEMTCLAAKEEEECDVKCFNDVISFDVTRDIQYFAQLWEGNPPMAPPNPRYAENVQDLKKIILSVAKQQERISISSISDFRVHAKDLWSALLNEDFVFSFKNTLEIVAYRKLEAEYGNWTWTLRSAMQVIENTLYNCIENGSLEAVDKEYLRSEMNISYQTWKCRIELRIGDLHRDLIDKTKRNFDEIIQQKTACKELEENRTCYENEIYNKSVELALKLKGEDFDKDKLSKEFESMWKKWTMSVTSKMSTIENINIRNDVMNMLQSHFEYKQIKDSIEKGSFKHSHTSPNHEETTYSGFKGFIKKGVNYIGTKLGVKQDNFEDTRRVRELSQAIERETAENIKKAPVKKMGYDQRYIQEIIKNATDKLMEFESKNFQLRKEFRLDLLLYLCDMAEKEFTNLHHQFREANDPRDFLDRKKPEYYSIFKIHCKDTTSAVAVADILCMKLKPRILQAAYNQSAVDVADTIRRNSEEFRGNRSNLEKHFLKSLAKSKKFEDFMKYVHDPQKYFENFITEHVKNQLDTNQSFLQIFKNNLKAKLACVTDAVEAATEQVKNQKEESDESQKDSTDTSQEKANVWLDSFCKKLADKLEFSMKDLKGISLGEILNFDNLKETMKRALDGLTEDLNPEFSSLSSIQMELFRETPAEILIKQLCDCCWVPCPFCAAICTCTIRNHDGDHSVSFHRPIAVNGYYYSYIDVFSIRICTTAVSSSELFSPDSSDRSVQYKKYREAGEKFACWNITPDTSVLPYWKWMVCQFKDQLENHYKKKFIGPGEIPAAWKELTEEDALGSLEKI